MQNQDRVTESRVTESSAAQRAIVHFGRLVRWTVLLLVLITVVDVFMRYFLKAGNIAVQEFEWHLFAALFLFGSSSSLASDQHVRVDVLYSRFSVKTKAAINLFGTLFFLLPFCSVVIWTSSGFMMQSYQIMEGSPDPGGLPFRFIAKSMIPIGFSLLVIIGVLQIPQFVRVIFARTGEVR
jgi:TRAP-type mannitol/chloroaromatic compound transport system permease small subunit